MPPDPSCLPTYAVLNTGFTVISADTGVGGNLGVSPGSSVTGFPPGVVTPPGVQHVADTAAGSAQTDAGNALTVAQGLTPNHTFAPVWDLVGQASAAGVYNDPSSFGLSGTVTLDGGGNPDSVFVFQAGSTLITSASSIVALTNGAQACNVFWAVGSSATLGGNFAVQRHHPRQRVGDDWRQPGPRTGVGRKRRRHALQRRHPYPRLRTLVGMSQVPLFGSALAGWVTLAAFVGGAAFLVFRRRLKPILAH